MAGAQILIHKNAWKSTMGMQQARSGCRYSRPINQAACGAERASSLCEMVTRIQADLALHSIQGDHVGRLCGQGGGSLGKV